MRNVIQPFSASLRALAVSASSCLLFLAPGSYKRVSEITLAFIQELLCRAGSGETRHGHRYLLLLQALLCSCLQPRAKDLQILRVLLGSLSCDCSEVKSLTGEYEESFQVSVFMQPWASFTLISVMRCNLHWQSETLMTTVVMQRCLTSCKCGTTPNRNPDIRSHMTLLSHSDWLLWLSRHAY